MNLGVDGLSLPVREDDLWPPGHLLQLLGIRILGFKGGSVKGAAAFLIILTRDEMIVKGYRGSTLDIGSDETTSLYKDGIEFFQEGSDYILRKHMGEFRCRTSDISRVLLGKFGAGTKLVAWVNDADGRERKVLEVILPTFLPKTIMMVANRAADEGLLDRSRVHGYNWHAWPLFRKEVERRLRQALPGATVEIRGRVLDDAIFMKLVR